MEDNLIEAEIGQIDQEGECPHVGYNGRWNKKADTCYCWWTGGTLEVSVEISQLDNLP